MRGPRGDRLWLILAGLVTVAIGLVALLAFRGGGGLFVADGRVSWQGSPVILGATLVVATVGLLWIRRIVRDVDEASGTVAWRRRVSEEPGWRRRIIAELVVAGLAVGATAVIALIRITSAGKSPMRSIWQLGALVVVAVAVAALVWMIDHAWAAWHNEAEHRSVRFGSGDGSTLSRRGLLVRLEFAMGTGIVLTAAVFSLILPAQAPWHDTPWFQGLLPPAGLAMAALGWLWMWRIRRATPEPDHVAWRRARPLTEDALRRYAELLSER